MKLLAGYYTHNKLRPSLLKRSLECFQQAIQVPQVSGCVSSWDPIPNLVCPNVIARYKNNGHLNIILQIQHIILSQPIDWDYFVCCEHDCLYSPAYFQGLIQTLEDNPFPGVSDQNHIGLNASGYCDIRSPTSPLFTMAIRRDLMKNWLETKLNECLTGSLNLMEPTSREGWLVRPREKQRIPVVHVNMNRTPESHHLTNHYDFYLAEPYASQDSFWGRVDSHSIFTAEELGRHQGVAYKEILLSELIYGDFESGKTSRVNGRVQPLLVSGKTIDVSNSVMGLDPAPGVLKKLLIRYRKCGTWFESFVSEGATFGLDML